MQHAPRARGLRVLVVGSGGREHALAWKLAQSPLLGELLAVPGNPGIARLAECLPVAAGDVAGIARLAGERRCDLVVVGPEDPLAAGLVDALQAAGLRAFGPTRAAARLESSKAFAREVGLQLGLPMPRSARCGDLAAALAYVRSLGDIPVAVKADGLFRGKGVVLAAGAAEAEAALRAMLVGGEYGDAGRTVVIQELLRGRERSYLALCDGERALLMLPAQDHKPAYDGDRGPNTGGMGVVAPACRPGEPSPEEIERAFFAPVLAELRARGTPFRGLLFAGVMLTAEGPKLLEFNARFGDPETEALLPLLESDLLPPLLAAADGSLAGHTLRWRAAHCVNVVMAAPGYPGAYPKGLPISGIEAAEAVPDALVFQAGTTLQDGRLVSDGGRVLCVAGVGPTLAAADRTALEAVRRLNFPGAQYRTDIGREVAG